MALCTWVCVCVCYFSNTFFSESFFEPNEMYMNKLCGEIVLDRWFFVAIHTQFHLLPFQYNICVCLCFAVFSISCLSLSKLQKRKRKKIFFFCYFASILDSIWWRNIFFCVHRRKTIIKTLSVLCVFIFFVNFKFN